jgi:hypothetical protein
VPPAQLGAFLIGTSTVLTVIGVAVAALVVLRTAEWRALAPAGRVPVGAPARP